LGTPKPEKERNECLIVNNKMRGFTSHSIPTNRGGKTGTAAIGVRRTSCDIFYIKIVISMLG